MAGDASTIARPYAEAVFDHAEEKGNLDLWSDMLSFLTAVVEEPTLAAVIRDPMFERAQLTDLMLEISGGRLNEEGANLVKLLVENGRLLVVPEITAMFEQLKAESQRMLKVHVRSAYVLKPAQEKQIAAALKAKLGRDVTVTSEKDPELIGGVHIRAGDLVIDGSVRGQLQQLANELGI
ncbi:F0F1 ATP synthase subunit delta [Candidatus Endoriftia persephone]|uniref:ATP synthase subunit delta n=3 Tax=Gammaproteobacteria TaxID=1236 RepID=G2FGI4_9GAMM|nr:F0F1 ATP synthase subunit delta [Candidatus Endoriftia persephone]EGV52639.1 ATP synthase subunit delta [endosymbiont of Riftia pachyptila (vent Ph05)]EGW54095.1 ATP synthase subunit delta [endosymbiont of Tevnia jerichonana (vent Tica)]USF87649.1 F0F1 ATP synthase subunit delta [Candidatus Endoriftia persephone]